MMNYHAMDMLVDILSLFSFGLSFRTTKARDLISNQIK